MSTVLDVAVCLLLIGVAVGTLAVAIPDERTGASVDSDPPAETITTVTTSVSVDDGQHAHGTLAQHLARAVLLSARLDGDPLFESSYPEATRDAVESDTPDRVHVTARWTPYSGAPLNATLSAGATPPSTAEVAATTLTVDSGVSIDSRDGSTETVAAAVSEAYITRMFPPERTRMALVDPRTASRTADRYRRFGGTLGVDIERPVSDAVPRRANGLLSAALAARLDSGLRSKGTDPGGETTKVGPEHVEIVVRRWEP